MSILHRYLGIQLIKGYLVVLAVLLVLFSFLNLLEQLEDVGQGDFELVDAFLYVLMTIPRRAVDLAPTTALLGTLISLGTLGRYGELTAVRAAGVSTMGMVTGVLLPAMAFVLAVLVVSELLAPALYQSAEQQRARALSPLSAGDKLAGKGFWARGGGEYINVRRMLSGQVPADIDIYGFDPDGLLLRYVKAERAEVQPDGSWRLHGVVRKVMDGSQLNTVTLDSMEWRPFWEQPPFQLSQVPLEGLSAYDLDAYLRYLKEVQQASPEIELLFWRRLVEPLNIPVMAVLALSFSFGSVRGSGFARQLVLGAITGVGFFLLTQMLYTAGLNMALPPALVAFGPFAGIAVLSSLVLRRAIR